MRILHAGQMTEKDPMGVQGALRNAGRAQHVRVEERIVDCGVDRLERR